jgi:hypothetical protein
MRRATQYAYEFSHTEPPMPSNETEGDRKEAYAAHFEQDVLNAAEYLGWEMVNSIIEDAKARA